MRADITEGIVVQEVSDAPRPCLVGYAVAVDRPLLGDVILWLLGGNPAVDVKG